MTAFPYGLLLVGAGEIGEKAVVKLFARLRVESDAMLHLDALRFLASAGIVWHHTHEYLYPAADRAALFERTRGLALFVDLFFVISGFVIAFVYASRIRNAGDYRLFLQRRIARLIPLHWLTLLVAWGFWSAALTFTARINHPPETGWACVMHTAFLLNGIFDCGSGRALNGVTWSISAEMALYLLFPLFVWLMRVRTGVPLLFAISIAVAVWLAAPSGLWDTVHPVARALPSFLFGILLFTRRDWLRSMPASSTWVVSLLSVATAAMIIGISEYLVLLLVWSTATAAVAADARLCAAKVVRGLAPLGQLTYGIYMWHSIIVLAVVNILGDKFLRLGTMPMAALLSFTYILIMSVAYVSLFVIETPARRWVDRLGSGRRRDRMEERAAASAAP